MLPQFAKDCEPVLKNTKAIPHEGNTEGNTHEGNELHEMQCATAVCKGSRMRLERLEPHEPYELSNCANALGALCGRRIAANLWLGKAGNRGHR